MDDIFRELERKGNNNVACIIKWMMRSKVIHKAKCAELKARKLFKSTIVGLEEFMAVLVRVASEQHKNVDELANKLTQHGPELFDWLEAGASKIEEKLMKRLTK